MATVREYFDTDFRTHVCFEGTLKMYSPNEEIGILTHVHQDMDSNTMYLSFFIPENKGSYDILIGLLNSLDMALAIGQKCEIQLSNTKETIFDGTDLVFSGRIFVYSESEIPLKKAIDLQKELKQNGLFLQFRGPQFALKRTEKEKPLAFISHDTRDKEAIARPIAIGLSKLMCSVWFDEYSLKIGDNLRESIEKGIKECQKCVLVLSPNFLSNQGWTKVEFNSIFTRELIEDTNLVLPIWCGIEKKELFEYCPTLVNKVGVKIEVGIEEIVRKLRDSIRN